MKEKTIKTCAPEKLDIDALERVNGGISHSANDAVVWKHKYNRETAVNMKWNYAHEYLWNRDVEFVSPPKYPCPVCRSWNVSNADPGFCYQMRVVCRDCGAFKCRDGSDPWGLGEAD